MASIVAGVIMARLLELSVSRTADAAVPAIGGGVFLAKTGCFLNGCCAGQPSDMPWAITMVNLNKQVPGTGIFGGLNDLARAAANPVATHPIAIYEIIAVVLALAVAWFFGRGRSPGGAFFIFAAIFTTARLIVLTFRANQSEIELVLYPILYVVIILSCGALFFRSRFAGGYPALDTGQE